MSKNRGKGKPKNKGQQKNQNENREIQRAVSSNSALLQAVKEAETANPTPTIPPAAITNNGQLPAMPPLAQAATDGSKLHAFGVWIGEKWANYKVFGAIIFAAFSFIGSAVAVWQSWSETKKAVASIPEQIKLAVADVQKSHDNHVRAHDLSQRMHSRKCKGNFDGTIKVYLQLRSEVPIDSLSPSYKRFIYENAVAAFASRSTFHDLTETDVDLFAKELVEDYDDCACNQFYLGVCYTALSKYSKARQCFINSLPTIEKAAGVSCNAPRKADAVAWLLFGELLTTPKETGQQKAESAWELLKTLVQQKNGVPADTLPLTFETMTGHAAVKQEMLKASDEVRKAFPLLMERAKKKAFAVFDPQGKERTVIEVEADHPNAERTPSMGDWNFGVPPPLAVPQPAKELPQSTIKPKPDVPDPSPIKPPEVDWTP